MTYLPELRSSLVQAAERAADPGHAADRHSARGTRRPAFGLRSIPVALGVAVAVGIAILALTQIHNRLAVHPPAQTPATQGEGRQALLDVLGVLRRPQTRADLHSGRIAAFLKRGAPILTGAPDLALVRLATTTPWGARVFLVPERPVSAVFARVPDRRAPSAGNARLRRVRESGEQVAVLGGSGGTCCATASDIESRGILMSAGAGRSFAGGSTETRLILVVPDGVAKVAFVMPRQANRTDPTAPIYRHALTVTARVRGNVAAVQVPRECCAGEPPMTWYAPDGQVVKRLGDPAAANRVVSPPKPGPETAQSRAAEHDPSTPNRVWVTPVTGGPHANYLVHFRILLNDADYTFHFSGTRCPAITFAGGQGGGSGNLRGRLFSGVLDAVHGQSWCPGTYRVSVSVMDLGRAANLKHPAKPFGTATFTVHS